MNKSIFSLIMAVGLAAGSASAADDLNAELVMSADRVWKGAVKGRDGDWVTFLRMDSTKSIRLGANTIKEIIFEVSIDEDLLAELNQSRDFQRMIDIVNRKLDPYRAYSDIPSNLTRYNVLLMDLYYKIGDYEKTAQIAKKVAADDRNERYQNKARVYQALAFIDLNRADEAEALLAEYGWDQELNDDSPPAQLFIAGKLLANKKEYSAAMEMVAKIIAFHSQDTDWMQPSEYFCAEIYVELGATNPIMYESAAQVIKQISLLYPNSHEADKAARLKLRLDELRAEAALKQSESEDV